MKEILTAKLLEYIRENNPELFMQLQVNGAVTDYLVKKIASIDSLLSQYKDSPAYIAEEASMNELTKDLRPSKFHYIRDVLEENFQTVYGLYREKGILQFEVINLVSLCRPVFEDLHFSEENEDNQFLKYCIIGTIGEYFEDSVVLK